MTDGSLWDAGNAATISCRFTLTEAMRKKIPVLLFTVLLCGASWSEGGLAFGARENTDEPDLVKLHREVDETLKALEQKPDSPEHRKKFLSVFEKVYSGRVSPGITPEMNDVAGRAYTKAREYALAGDKVFIKAMMMASRGDYGYTTVEGSEWLNELLWEIFQEQVQRTLDVLFDLPPKLRDQLINDVYTQPIHDGFDFVAILKGLGEADVSQEREKDVERIRETVDYLAESQTQYESPKDPWYDEPKEIPDAEFYVRPLARNRHAVVVESEQGRAQARLEGTAFVEVAGAEAREWTGAALPLENGKRFFLVRGLFQNEYTGEFTLFRHSGRLLVHHTSLGRGALPLTRTALVVQLDRPPHKVYVVCDIEE